MITLFGSRETERTHQAPAADVADPVMPHRERLQTFE
ncbi:Uncharacterised protein [Mycobacteroides abscessus subsp. abscessus]|nr:Uncharacterised protein [Mycobacteroides abscessus subsp. abscessus]